MDIKSIIKRGVYYILHGVPEYKTYPKVVSLAPSELLQGKTALITGGTSGIGFEIAKAYINAGATVVITGRSEDRLQSTCNQLNTINGGGKKVFSVIVR